MLSIGEKIKMLRTKMGYTQEELAEYAGTKKQTIHKYETGIITNIPAKKIKLISEKLGTTPSYLMGWDDFATDDTILQDEENRLVNKYRQLNDFGQQKADEYIGDLLENPKYRLQQQNSADTTQQTTADEQKKLIERMLERQKDKNRFDVAAFGGGGVHSGTNEVSKETIEEILNKHKK